MICLVRVSHSFSMTSQGGEQEPEGLCQDSTVSSGCRVEPPPSASGLEQPGPALLSQRRRRDFQLPVTAKSDPAPALPRKSGGGRGLDPVLPPVGNTFLFLGNLTGRIASPFLVLRPLHHGDTSEVGRATETSVIFLWRLESLFLQEAAHRLEFWVPNCPAIPSC